MSEGAIKVAQIGCGHWGRNLARNFAELGVLAAVADADAETAERIGGQNGAAVRSLDAILADPSIDAVSLASPAASHAEMALAAIRACKHVFVEKPLALSPIDGAAVVAAAEQANRDLRTEVAEGATAAQISTFQGTHTGPLMTADGRTIPPTGRHVVVPYVLFLTVRGGRAVRAEFMFDQLDLLGQLGLLPT